MTHFPVDDQFAFHPKAIAAGNAALGLWVRAGAHCKQHVTGGFVDERVALSMGTKADVKALVAVELWEVAPGGYQFHDWADVAGNATAEVERERREKARASNRKRQAELQKRRATANAADNGDINGVSNGESNGTITEYPSPSPDDVTTSSESGHQPQRARKDSDSESRWATDAALLGISDLPAIRAAFEAAVEHPVSNPVAVELAAAVLAKSKDLVRNVDAYLAQTCRNSAAELQGIYLDIDTEALAS